MTDSRSARGGMEEKYRSPRSELRVQAPGTHSPLKPREVRRQGYPRESRSPSRRVVVKLGSWPACADGAPHPVGRRLQLHDHDGRPGEFTGDSSAGSRANGPADAAMVSAPRCERLPRSGCRSKPSHHGCRTSRYTPHTGPQ